MQISDELAERIGDAVEDALDKHVPSNESVCGCGAPNNMDGDVLHGHRHGVITQAVLDALGAYDDDPIHQTLKVHSESQCPDCGYAWLNGALAHDCAQFRADVEAWRAAWSNMWPANHPPSNGDKP
ncbi:hypothetical protein [Mycobacteroides abscessus]|uniref:hypothetical protein n=1 Tax=Mycobacteroides abscessus TaxID=36809 RepID=UPI000C2567D0|nr:hypothetical protein [Mycobacteroides abscessus]RIR38472.1 hypothetical protein D2E38_07335 [Mycobacteroides abscessus]RIR38574.1 hypothetical protein D2E36_17115 [Mycobacteroides abscessus]RIS43069.1 hypothetical protein D2E71_15890 [Mycobacteroides abscessus]RIT01330.1 hypothetical protein D2E72_24645 [Mycobacteroides abscessus]RIT20953.1 hypothetical protein D2E81_15795 [Mycobacteroides abscessus]